MHKFDVPHGKAGDYLLDKLRECKGDAEMWLASPDTRRVWYSTQGARSLEMAMIDAAECYRIYAAEEKISCGNIASSIDRWSEFLYRPASRRRV